MEKILLFKIRLKEWSKKNNPNKKDSKRRGIKTRKIQIRDQQTFDQLTGGAFKKFVTGN